MKFQVRKVIEFTQEDVEAESPEEALAAFDPGQATIRLVRERVKGERRGPEQGAIADRELRVGRAFQGKHKGRTFTATVLAPDRIEVRDAEGNDLGTYPSLNKAAQAATGLTAINAWRWFREAEAAAPEPVAEGTPPAPARKKAAPKKAAKKSRKRAS